MHGTLPPGADNRGNATACSARTAVSRNREPSGRGPGCLEGMTTQLATRPAVRWYGVGAVTLGIFAIVTTEILPIGLLTPIGADFALTPGRTGWLMTMPGLVAAVAA